MEHVSVHTLIYILDTYIPDLLKEYMETLLNINVYMISYILKWVKLDKVDRFLCSLSTYILKVFCGLVRKIQHICGMGLHIKCKEAVR
jgi:hypothetical protein